MFVIAPLLKPCAAVISLAYIYDALYDTLSPAQNLNNKMPFYSWQVCGNTVIVRESLVISQTECLQRFRLIVLLYRLSLLIIHDDSCAHLINCGMKQLPGTQTPISW